MVWISRLPNRFQTSCAGDVTAEYQPRPGGGFVVINRCRDHSGNTTHAEGVARVVEGRPTFGLQVRFAPPFLSLRRFVWATIRSSPSMTVTPTRWSGR